MHIERLSDFAINSAFDLCSSIKEHDRNPCSFWGYTLEDLERLVDSKDKIAFVSMAGSTVTGIGTLNRGGRFQEHWAEISIAIHPAHRNTGTGKALARRLEEVGRESGLEFIKALILENNLNSRSFFSRIGYEHRATLFHEFKLEPFGLLNDCAYYKELAAK